MKIKEIKLHLEKEKKKKKKTLVWRLTLDPCSTRIFVICSKPLKAAKWRAVIPDFNKKKVVQKRIKTKWIHNKHETTNNEPQHKIIIKNEIKQRNKNKNQKKWKLDLEDQHWFHVQQESSQFVQNHWKQRCEEWSFYPLTKRKLLKKE